MVHVKYIKRGGKLHGPYYYQSVRGKDGKIHKVYLGKNYQPGDEKQRQRPHLAAVLIPLLLICGLSFFVLKDVTLQSVPITGNMVFDVYRTVSAEAYMEVDGIAQPLPAKVEKQGEGEYGFNISTLNVQLSKGEHTVRILDQGEVVYEAVITIGKEQDNQGIGENATALAHNQSAEKGIGENVSVIARERKEENESYETIFTNETGVQVNATEIRNVTSVIVNETIALNNSVVNETNTFVVNVTNGTIEMNGSDYDILEERTIGEVRALQKATWVRKVRVNKENDILVELPDVARPSRAFLVEDGERYERTWEGKSVVLHKAKKDEEYEIEYETDGPFLEEVNLSAFRKRVIVGSPLNFTNVMAFTSLPKPVRKESVRLEWVDTKSVHEVESFIDTNNDSLVEGIEWTVPHLSNQTFDISITVLNVYTYLRDNETWMVSFNTTGQADLIITPMQSSFTEVLQDNASTFNELVLQGLQCGEQDLLQNLWVNISSGGLVKYVSIQPTESIPVQSLVYQNYSCEGTGNLTTFVLKAGYAMLEFNFGGERTYAIDPVRVETAYPGSTVQLRAQACSKNNAGTNPLSFTATCSGTYPSMSCVAGGDRLGCDDNVIEEDASTAGPGEFSGVNASFFNATITDCLKITQVKVCHNVWFGGSDTVATANVTVARNNGVTVSLAYSTSLDLDVDPGLSCQDVTANFSWVCSDFFGPTGPRATATAQIRSGDFIGAIGKVDVLFYNVTYEAAHSVLLNSTNMLSNDTLQNLTATVTGQSADTNSYAYSWRVNGTPMEVLNLPMTDNASSSDQQTIYDFSGFNALVQLGRTPQGDTNEPLFNKTGGPDKNGAYVFDGINDFINVSHSLAISPVDAWTVDYWVYLARDPDCDGTNNWRWMYTKGDPADFQGGIFEDILEQGRTITTRFILSNRTVYGRGTTGKVEIGRWTHVVETYDSRSGRFRQYLNGTLDGEITVFPAKNMSVNTAPLYINAVSGMGAGGGCVNSNGNFNGSYASFKLYNRSLTPEQVRQNYFFGFMGYNVTVHNETFKGENWSVLVTPLNSSGWNGSTVFSNNMLILDAVPSITSLILNATNVNNNTDQNLTAYPIGASDPDGNSVFYNYNWRVNGTSLTVLNLPMTNNASSGNGQTVFDFSGYNTPVTLGTPARGGTDEPKFNITGCLFSTGCYVFDGSNDFLNVSYVPSMNFSGASFTVAAWARRASSGGHHYIFGDGADGGTNIALGVGFRSTNVFTCAFYNNDLNTVATYTDTNWHHWVCTYDAVTNARKLYRDGAQVAGDTASADYVGSGNTQIGSKPVVAEPGYFNGQISHVVLYNRSLTHLQVFALYENRTDLLSFNETVKGENWSVAVTPIDSEGWNGSTVFSNNLLILDAVPSITSVILNATNLNNDTSQNLTAYPTGASDPDGDAVSYNYNWRVNSTSIALLNMPMTNNASASDGQTVWDFSGYGGHGTLGAFARGDVDEPVFQRENCPGGGGCYRFDGKDGKEINMSRKGQYNFSEAFSVEAWVNVSAFCISIAQQANAADSGTFALYAVSQENPTALGCSLAYNDGRFDFAFINQSGVIFEHLSPLVYKNQEYHVIASYNRSHALLYVNGSLANSSFLPGFGFIQYNSTAELRLGTSNYNGTLGAVRIYNRSLSAEQVGALYQNRVNNVTVAQETSRDENWSVAVTPIDSEGVNGTTVLSNNLLILDSPPSITSVILNATNVNNDTSQNLTAYPIGASDPDGDAVSYNYNWRVNGTSVAVLNMPMTNNASSSDGQRTFDFSGYGGTGQLGSMVRSDGNEPHFTTTRGCASQDGCYFFDNFFEHINMSTKPQFNITNEITIEAWVNLTGSFADRAIVSRCITPSSVCSYEIGFPVSVSSRVEFILMNATGNRTQLATAANAIEQNRIVHLVATRNASTMNIYINGSLAASSLAFSGAIQTNNSVDLFIGQDSDLSQPWHGTIDDVRIYNRSLSALQVWQNYQIGANSTVADETVKGENWSVAVTLIDSEGWNGSTVVSNTVTIANSLPENVTLTTPANATYFNTNSIFLNWTAANDNDTDSLTYFLFVNGSNVNATTVLNLTHTLPEGYFDWTILVGDGEANSSFASNRTFTIDMTQSRTTYIAPTETTGVERLTDAISINVSVYESNPLQNITFWLFNRTGIVNQTVYTLSSNTSNVSINFTNVNITAHRFKYNVTIYDIAGNLNTTETRTITLNTPPTLSNIILNATDVNNNTIQNLTAYPIGARDIEGDNVTYNYNWYVNGTSLALLNLEMTNANYSADRKTTFDLSGYNHNAHLGNTTFAARGDPEFRTGKFCPNGRACYLYDGFGDDYINVTVNAVLNSTVNSFSIEAWANETNINNNRYIVTRSSGVLFGSFYLKINPSPSGFSFGVWNRTGMLKSATGSRKVDGRVFHAIGTYNGSLISLYVNGSLVATANHTGPVAINNSLPIMIGNDPTGGFFLGVIGPVRIYNRSLSAQEVSALYKHGTNNVTVAQETVKGENWSVGVTPIDSEGVNGSTVFSNNVVVQNTGPSIGQVILNSTDQDTNDTNQNLTAYRVNADDIDLDSVNYNYNWRVNGTSITILNMPMTNNASASDGQTVFDFSGYNNFGTLGLGQRGDTAEPKFSATGCLFGESCYDFDGSNDYINLGNSTTVRGTGDLTIVWWQKLDTVPSAGNVEIITGYGSLGETEPTNFQYAHGVKNTAGVTNAFAFHENGAGSNNEKLSLARVQTGVWMHIAIIRNTSAKTYQFVINGTAEPALVYSTNPTGGTVGNATIGNSHPGFSEFIDGMIDNVYIFNKTLSVEQVIAIYENKSELLVAQETTKGENWSVAVTPIDSEGWNGSTVFSNNVSIVNSPPQNVTLITPVNGSYWANGRMFLNWTEAVDNDTDSFTYFLFVNGSNVNATNALNITHSLPEGYFDWTILVGDGEANSSFAFNRTFIVDTTRPRGGYLAPTPAHEERLLADTISVNVTIFDRNLENITFWLFNTTSIVNQTFYLLTGNVSNVSINFTGLNRAVHRYFYNVSIFDKAGNLNVTQTRGVTLNLPPTITTVIVNSTNIATNDTLQNLTAFVEGASDVGEDNVTLNYNWLINGTPIALVNLPMTDASYSNDNQTVFDFSGYNYYGTLGRYATGDNAEPLFTRVGCGFWNRCYKFDGSNDFINLSRKPGFNISDEITIEAWFVSTGSGSLTLRLLTRCINTAGVCSYLLGVIPSTSTGQVALKNTTGQFLNLYSTGTVRANQLVHLVATYNGTVTSLYVNGSLTDASTNLSGPLETANTLETIIGARPDLDPSLFFKGQIAEMRVYNRSLSAEQVRQNYLLGNGGYNVTVSQEVFKNENWSVGVTPIDSEGVNGTTVFSNNLLILDAPPSITSVILNSTNPTADDTLQNLTAYPLGGSDPDGDDVFYNYNWLVNGNGIAVLNMPMTNNASSSDGQTTFDFSGYNNFGRLATLSGTLNTESFPIFNTTTCISQDGCYQFIKNNNQTINISFAQSLNMTRMTTGFTITAWVYSLSAGTNEGFFRQDDGGTMRGFNIAIRNNANTLQFSLWNTSGHLQPLGTNNTRFLRGRWMHVVAVYNTTHTLLYINGTEGNSQLFTGIPQGTGYRFIIGSVAGAGVAGNWLGNIDELVWYNRTLSKEQINALYEQRTHNLTISQETFKGENWSVTVTPIDSEGRNGTTVLSNNLTILNSPPGNVTLTIPVNDSFFNTNSIFFNWTEAVDNDTDSFTYFLFVNGSNVNATNALNITHSLPEGYFDWAIRASDGQANSSFSENRTFTVDTTAPRTRFTALTEANNTFRTFDFIFANVSVYDLRLLQNTTFSLFNATGIVNETVYSLGDNLTNGSLNWTGLGNGQYLYNVSVHDKAGNINVTETRTLTLDSLLPSVVFINNTERNNTFVSRNFIFMNISLFEVNPANITFFLFNQTSLVNQTTYALGIGMNTSNVSINFTNLNTTVHQFMYNITLVDFAGNLNISETRLITLNLPPSIQQVILSATSLSNNTEQNLTAYPAEMMGTSDPEGDNVTSNYNWLINRSSMTGLNLPMTNAQYSSTTQTTFDFSGHGAHGILGTAVAGDGAEPVFNQSCGIDGEGNGCYQFNGSQYINVSKVASLNLTIVLGVEAWVYPESIEKNNGIVDWTDAGATNGSYMLFVEDGVAKFRLVRQDSTVLTISSDVVVPVRRWTHLVGIYNRTHMGLYVNGTLQRDVAAITSVRNVNGPLLVGTLGMETSGFNGSLDDVKVYNASLSRAQVEQNYFRGFSGYNITVGEQTAKLDIWTTHVTPIDHLGLNGTSTVSNSIRIENTMPANVSLIAPANGSYVNTDLVFMNWTASNDSDGDAITYYLFVNGVNVNATVEPNITHFLADGVYDWTVSADDTLQNTSFAQNQSFTVDTTLPDVAVTSSAGTAFTVGTATTITCSATDVNSFEVRLTGDAACVGAMACSASFSPASSGTKTVTCTGTDLAGNSMVKILSMDVTSPGGGGGSSGGGGGGGGGGGAPGIPLTVKVGDNGEIVAQIGNKTEIKVKFSIDNETGILKPSVDVNFKVDDTEREVKGVDVMYIPAWMYGLALLALAVGTTMASMGGEVRKLTQEQWQVFRTTLSGERKRMVQFQKVGPLVLKPQWERGYGRLKANEVYRLPEAKQLAALEEEVKRVRKLLRTTKVDISPVLKMDVPERMIRQEQPRMAEQEFYAYELLNEIEVLELLVVEKEWKVAKQVLESTQRLFETYAPYLEGKYKGDIQKRLGIIREMLKKTKA